MTDHSLSSASPEKTRVDLVVVGVVVGRDGPEIAPGGEGVAGAYGKKLSPLLASLDVTGKPGTVTRIPTGGTLRSPLLMLVGLGAVERLTTDAVRRGAGVAARSAGNVATVALALPAIDADHVRAVVEGWELGGYRFDAFRSQPAETGPGSAAAGGRVSAVSVLSPAARSQAAQDALAEALVVARATALARDWVNTPPGDLAPAAFADAVVERADALKPSARRKSPVGVEVLDETQLEAGGYGGILVVGGGSANPPRLVRMSYSPKKPRAHLALVGKGITFDSGGLSIKPAGSMATMKCDMGGAAAVIAATLAIAELGLPVAVTTYAPMAENMPSGTAARPGDVYTSLSGRTVEVLNTDAEGRLVLADGLTRAVGDSPDLVVDVATLTGACIVALGERVAGVMGNDDAAIDDVLAAAAAAGEQAWPLPIPDEMREKVRSSKVADLAQHNPERWGGTLYAAAFLREFVGETTWAHLDIAGPAYNDKTPWGHVSAGGTGYGVATLVELARRL